MLSPKEITYRHNLARLMTLVCACDMIFTYMFVQRDGVHMEANPVVRMVIESFGLEGFVIMKLVLIAVWLAVAEEAKPWLHWVVIIPTAIAAIMGAIVVFNG